MHNFMLCGLRIRSWLHIGYPKELAKTRRQEVMMRSQLGNIPTDTRQTEMRGKETLCDQAFIYVVVYRNRLSRLI